MGLFSYINLRLARYFLSESEKHCCRCSHFKPSKGICGVYFLHNGETFCLRVSPWYECLLTDLQKDIKIADMDALHAATQEGSKEERHDNREDNNEQEKEEEGTEGICSKKAP